MPASSVFKVLVLITLLFKSPDLFNQEQHTVHRTVLYFDIKDNQEVALTTTSRMRRIAQNIPISTSDYLLNPQYLDSLECMNIKIVGQSRWLNAVLVDIPTKRIEEVTQLGFVSKHEIFVKNITESDQRSPRRNHHSKEKAIAHKRKELETTTEISPQGYANIQNHMIGIDSMHADNFKGKGITIAVFDAGFYKANETSVLQPLFENNQILGTYDFIDKEENVFNDHHHGTKVLSILGAQKPMVMLGAAYEANYYLFRTENIYFENRLEEFYWLMAAEKADSLGVNIIHSSLGYYDFDGKSQDYTADQLDGKTTIITQAANMCVQKGMIVVCSAGNEGNTLWGSITAPADSKEVLAVGAINQQKEYVDFSSRGFSESSFIKPDITALGYETTVAALPNEEGLEVTSESGTSFSCPIITGLCAGIWQASPDLSNKEVVALIKQSATHHEFPNRKIGNGIPSYTNVKKMIQTLDMRTDISSSPISLESIATQDPNGIEQLLIGFPEHYIDMYAQISIQSLDGNILFTTEKKVINQEMIISTSNTPLNRELYMIEIKIDQLKQYFKYLPENNTLAQLE